MKRHLSPFLVPSGESRAAGEKLLSFALKTKRADQSQITPPPEFNIRDYTIMLLQIGAQIEHALMVEYLYAAYSLGGPQIPPEHQNIVRGWQQVILGIAKEEMGHFNLSAPLTTPESTLHAPAAPYGGAGLAYPFTAASSTASAFSDALTAKARA